MLIEIEALGVCTLIQWPVWKGTERVDSISPNVRLESSELVSQGSCESDLLGNISNKRQKGSSKVGQPDVGHQVKSNGR